MPDPTPTTPPQPQPRADESKQRATVEELSDIKQQLAALLERRDQPIIVDRRWIDVLIATLDAVTAKLDAAVARADEAERQLRGERQSWERDWAEARNAQAAFQRERDEALAMWGSQRQRADAATAELAERSARVEWVEKENDDLTKRGLAEWRRANAAEANLARVEAQRDVANEALFEQTKAHGADLAKLKIAEFLVKAAQSETRRSEAQRARLEGALWLDLSGDRYCRICGWCERVHGPYHPHHKHRIGASLDRGIEFCPVAPLLEPAAAPDTAVEEVQ